MAKRGRPPKGPYTGRTVVFSTRIRPDTRGRLEAAARAAGRSLSQEFEHRLRRTFTEDDRVIDFFGDPKTAAIVKLIGLVIQSVNRVKGRPSGALPWTEQPHLFDQAVKAVAGVLELFRPPGEVADPFADVGGDQLGRVAALGLIEDVQLADPTLPIAQRSTRQHALAVLREGLGELADRPQPYGFTADERRQLRKLSRPFWALWRKANGTRQNLTPEEHKELWRLWDEIQALHAHRQKRLHSREQPRQRRKNQAKRRTAK
jgi:hypothetical protein